MSEPICPGCGGDMFGALTCPCWDELPGMWEAADFMGGATDAAAHPEPEAEDIAVLGAERARREAAEAALRSLAELSHAADTHDACVGGGDETDMLCQGDCPACVAGQAWRAAYAAALGHAEPESTLPRSSTPT